MAFNSAFQVKSYNDIYLPTGKTCTQTAIDDPAHFSCIDGNDNMPNLCIEVQNGQSANATFQEAGTSNLYPLVSVNYIGTRPPNR